MVHRGQRGGAQRDLRHAVERLLVERELLATLPSLRASIGRTVTRKVGVWGGSVQDLAFSGQAAED